LASSRELSRAGRGASGHHAAGRVPPQDLEAEKSVLSSILLDDRSLDTVIVELKPEDFYHPAHRALFEAMLALRDAKSPVDLLTLSDHLNSRKLLDAIGGPVFLAEIADYETTAANVLHHARIVRDKSVRRALIGLATEIVELGFDSAEPAQQLLNVAQGRMFELGQLRSRSSFQIMEKEVHEAINFVEELMERGGGVTGLQTGFSDLDRLTGGLQPGDLVILAARPSMGKTALALNVARNAAVDGGKKVAIFSLEMTTRSLVLRLLAAEARIESSVFRSGYVSTSDYQKLARAADRLGHARIFIDDGSAATVLEMEAKARRLHAEHGLDLVVVDYLQLARGDGSAERREQEISEISRGLKGLAKELRIPVMALSQLNRGPEARSDKRPMLADLRESGAIEQDADLIAFIYRDEVYHKDTDDEGIAEIIVAKQRNGPTDTVRLRFEGRYTLFQNLSGRDDAPAQVGGALVGAGAPAGPFPAAGGFEDDGF
jgi:replicative DNA helicase